MKSYIVFARRPGQPWLYGDTFTSPMVAWEAMLLIRAKGLAAKIMIVGPDKAADVLVAS